MRCVGLALGIVCLVLNGCGGGGGKISGTVTLDGQPLEAATVTFTPKGGGRPAIGSTNSSGRFELEYLVDDPDVPPGDYVVRITTLGSKQVEGRDIEIPERVPAKYNSESELFKTVTGSEEFPFELTTRD